MPCYDPPPPWADDARRNAEQAARILCAMIGKSLNSGGLPSDDLLQWYLGHRRIDLQVAQGGGYYRAKPADEVAAIKADIARVEALLR